MRSFRSTLALRVTTQALVVAVVCVAIAAIFLRRDLIRGLDASLGEIAEIVARAGADQLTPEYRFPVGVLPGRGNGALSQAPPRAQLLSAAGVSVVRGDSMQPPLPVPEAALERARRGTPAFESHAANGVALRSVVFPLAQVSAAHEGHFLQVALPEAGVRSGLMGFLQRITLIALLGVGAVGLVTWRVAGRALEPALSLTAAVESIAVNELGDRVSSPGNLLEFQRMAVAFNGLLDRIEHAVTGTRRFTSDASHELRAPLTVLRGELELALSRPRSAQEYEEVIRRCLEEVLRLARLADDLLTLTRVEGGVIGGKRVSVDLHDVVERAVLRKSAVAGARGVRIEVTGSAGNVAGDADLLLRAVDGLVEHAIMASPPGGTVRITLSDGARPAVTVADSGPGINRDDISGVFQRFYRSNRSRSSSEESGLGLSIARAVAISHGGALEYAGNNPGASFRMSLPNAPDSPRSHGKPA